MAQLRTLPEDEQDRAAEVLLAFAHDRRDYTLDAEQIEGIRRAITQADKGQFQSTSDCGRVLAAHYRFCRVDDGFMLARSWASPGPRRIK